MSLRHGQRKRESTTKHKQLETRRSEEVLNSIGCDIAVGILNEILSTY